MGREMSRSRWVAKRVFSALDWEEVEREEGVVRRGFLRGGCEVEEGWWAWERREWSWGVEEGPGSDIVVVVVWDVGW